MSNMLETKALALTSTVTHQLHQCNFDPIFPLFHPEICWIGPSAQSALTGSQNVQKALSSFICPPLYMVTEEHYQILHSSVRLIFIAGHYLASTMPGSRFNRSDTYRISCVWIQTDKKLLLLHMHISFSSPWQYQNVFPFLETVREPSLLLPPESIGGHQSRRPLHFRGPNAQDYFFQPCDILYVEASNVHTLFFLHSCSYVINAPINRVASVLPEHFIRIHRSFIVNQDYVLQLNRYYVELAGGIKLPVPEKRYRDVKHKLLEPYQVQSD